MTMPAYRGLYLDALLGKNEGLQVNRDRQFRSMVRNFKSVAESDYQVPAHLEPVLRPYQKVGFQWLKTLESCHFGGILADEMGLGKTVQIIAYLSTVPFRETGMPSLVVCPTSLILNWGDELARFAPQLRSALIMGPAAERKEQMETCGDWDLWVTSYDLFKGTSSCMKAEPSTPVCWMRGRISKSGNLGLQGSQNHCLQPALCAHRHAHENRLSELWNLFDFLMPGYLFSHAAFVEKLERPIAQSKDPRLVAAQPPGPAFLLRRLKQAVLKELPPKMEHVRRVQGFLRRSARPITLWPVQPRRPAPGRVGISCKSWRP